MSVPLQAQALAKLGELATSLGTALTNIAGVQGTVNTIRTDITNARDNVNATTNAARDNVKEHVTAWVSSISNKAPVRSVQSGVMAINIGSPSAAVTIGWIANPSACLVTVSPLGINDSGSVISTYQGHSLANNSLTITRSGTSSSAKFSWSVVEFNVG